MEEERGSGATAEPDLVFPGIITVCKTEDTDFTFRATLVFWILLVEGREFTPPIVFSENNIKQ